MKISLSNRRGAFSLVEVVVAVGIFALAIVGVIGLLAPTSKAVSDVADTDAASRVVGSIQAGLQQAGYDVVKNLLADATIELSDSNYNLASTKSGDRVGLKLGNGSSPFSTAAEQFFEFALVRNETLSPQANDETSGFLAFTLSLRWPAFLPNGTEFTASEQKGQMMVPMVVTR